ncbi:MAG: acryloyl-CoA reductase [Granulosicoccaceae bacterium]
MIDTKFSAYRIHAHAGEFSAKLTQLQLEDLTEGDVVIEVAYSSINYKDALAATGRGKILRAPTLNGGIDMAGIVSQSSSPLFNQGDEVFSCAAGLSEFYDGGYAQVARLPASTLRKVPEGLSMRDTMAFGTAGITAAIAVQRMEDNGQTKTNGPIVVTGASGGVGSFAVNMLSQIGYDVVASSGKKTTYEYLRRLGASNIIDRYSAGDKPPRPLEKGLWGGAVDTVGGDTLSWLNSTTKPWGNIACIGLTSSTALNTTVMPQILRGVSLLGINCMELPDSMLEHCWQRLATDLNPTQLDLIAPGSVSLQQLPDAFDAYMAGEVSGRTVVTIK